MIQTISQTLALILQIATLITIIYAFIKFANKPNVSQNERLSSLEEWRKTVDERLGSGSDHFDRIDEGNRYTQEALLALLEHAIDGNHNENLINAKDNLQKYLIRK